MSQRWFVFQDDQVQGPFTPQELRQKAAVGQIQKSTLVSSGDDNDWREAGELPGLFSAAAPPPPPRVPSAPAASGVRPPPVPMKAAGAAAPAAAPSAASGNSALVFAGIGAGVAALVVTVGIAVALALRNQPSTGDGENSQGLAAAEGRDSGADPLRSPAESSSSAEPVETPPASTPTTAASPERTVEPGVEPAPGPSAEPTAPPTTPEPPRAVDDTPATPALPPGRPGPQPPPGRRPVVQSPPPRPGGGTAAPVVVRPKLEPKPLLPPIVPEQTEVSDQEITDFNRRVATENTASDAYGLYLRFVQCHVFSGDQQQRVDEQLALWKGRAEEGLARLGSRWVKPEEALAARQKGREYIEKAEVLVRAARYKDAIDMLQEASRSDLNSVRADYILGLLYSLPRIGPVGAVEAEKYFRKVLDRSPDDPAALNSLAVSLIKQNKYDEAIRRLERAAELSPECPEVIQNAGRFAYLAANNRVAASSRTVVRKFENLHNSLVDQRKVPIYDKNTGWLHVIPVFPDLEQWDEFQASQQGDVALDRKRQVASGPGIIVAPDYVLTSRHLVESSRRWGGGSDFGIADEVRVSLADPTSQSREWVGAVVAVSDEVDLALLQIPGLNVPAAVCRAEPLELDGELMTFGYPARSQFGAGLQAARASVRELADRQREAAPEYVILDSELASGDEGGPILDAAGRLAGLMTIQFNAKSKQRGAAGPEAIQAFLAAHVPNWSSVAATAEDRPPADWTDVVQRAGRTIVRVKCFYEAGVPALVQAASQSPVERNTYEDFTCPICSGLAWLPCPQKGCSKGYISESYYETRTTTVGGKPSTVRIPQRRQVLCPTCRGANRLDCAGCDGGLDAVLLKDQYVKLYNAWLQRQTGGQLPGIPGAAGQDQNPLLNPNQPGVIPPGGTQPGMTPRPPFPLPGGTPPGATPQTPPGSDPTIAPVNPPAVPPSRK